MHTERIKMLPTLLFFILAIKGLNGQSDSAKESPEIPSSSGFSSGSEEYELLATSTESLSISSAPSIRPTSLKSQIMISSSSRIVITTSPVNPEQSGSSAGILPPESGSESSKILPKSSKVKVTPTPTLKQSLPSSSIDSVQEDTVEEVSEEAHDKASASKVSEPETKSKPVLSASVESKEPSATKDDDKKETSEELSITDKSVIETASLSESLESSISDPSIPLNDIHTGTAKLDPTSSKATPILSSSNPAVIPSASQSEQSSSSSDSFLGLEAPHAQNVGPSAAELELSAQPAKLAKDSPQSIDIGEPLVTDEDSSDLKKSSRQSSGLPGMNDLLSGLFNVVGEGLNIAKNYVKEKEKEEEEKRKLAEATKINLKKKQEELRKQQLEEKLDKGSKDSKRDKRPPSRINNRGPPRFTEPPLEEIPIELLNGNRPLGIGPQPQRPFRVKVTRTRVRPPPPYATGIPLPEQIVPLGGIQANTKRPLSGISPQSNDAPLESLFAQIGESAGARPPALGVAKPTQDTTKKGSSLLENKLEHTYFPDLEAPTAATPPKRKPGRRPRPTPKTTTPRDEEDEETTTSAGVTRYPPKRRPRPPKLPPVRFPPTLPPRVPPTTTPLTTTTRRTTKKTTKPPRLSTTTLKATTTTKKQITRKRRPTTTPTTPLPSRPRPRPQNNVARPRPRPTPQGGLIRATPSLPSQGTGKVRFSQNRPEGLVPGTVIDAPFGQGQPSIVTVPIQGQGQGQVFPTRYQAGPGGANGKPEIFDVTVTARQDYGGKKKPVGNPGGGGYRPNVPGGLIITQGRPGDQFVSIDGKRTYFNIGPSGQQEIAPTRPNIPATSGPNIGSALPVLPVEIQNFPPNLNPENRPDQNGSAENAPKPAAPTRRPTAPPVRIDTCIVGDDTACEKSKHEVCKTVLGVSSCFCRPGYGRKNHRHKCKKIVRLLMSMQVDRINQQRIFWSGNYLNPNSREYRTLEDEASYAIDSAMALTSLDTDYVTNSVNKFFPMNGKVTVNVTLEFVSNQFTRATVVKRDIQRKLIEVIQARGSNIGNGNLYVDGPLNPIPGVVDLNECSEPSMNDCHEFSDCINLFGSFTCVCKAGYGDRFEDDKERVGRSCQTCSKDFCYGRGICKIEAEQQFCECKGNYYGRQCEIDGEVVMVAIGASVTAVFIIVLTLICLCLWSRRWKRDQQKAEMLRHGFHPASVYGGGAPGGTLTPMGGPPPLQNLQNGSQYNYAMGKPPQGGPYPVGVQSANPTLEADRIRWAHLAEAAMNQNVYAQPDPSHRPVEPRRGTRTGPLPSIPQPSHFNNGKSAPYRPNPGGNRTPVPLLMDSESEDTDRVYIPSVNSSSKSAGAAQNAYSRPKSRASLVAGNGYGYESEMSSLTPQPSRRNPRNLPSGYEHQRGEEFSPYTRQRQRYY